MTTRIPVRYGGTGANNAAEARSFLGAAPSAAYDQANNAYVQANNAFVVANTGSSSAGAAYDQANNAYGKANSAYGQANVAYTQANTATTNADNAYAQANLAYGQANTATTNAGNAHEQANTATTNAGNAYAQANSASGLANSAYSQANSAYEQANTATTNAGNAYNQANTATTIAGNAYGQANSAHGQANTARDQANSAYGQANTATTNAGNAYNQANNAYAQANTAYDAANSKLSLTGGTVVGDILITGNLFVNGVETIVSTQSLTINDPIFLLANNNTTNSVGLGFTAHYGPTQQHAGLIRAHQDNNWYLFEDYNEHILYANNILDLSQIKLATLRANINANSILLTGNSVATQANLTLAHNQANSAYTAANTAQTTAQNAYGQANTATTNAGTAQTTAQNAYGAANTAQTTAQNAYGQANSAYGAANTKVSSVSGTSSRITSSGGTTPTIDLATAGAGAASYSSGISALTVDAYGRVTSVTGSAGYATTSSLSSYLPLAGGTMTGQLNIGTATNLAFGSATRQMIDLWSTSYGIGVQSGTQYYRTGGRFSWHRGGSHNDNENNPGGGTVAMTLDGNSSLSVTGDVRTPIFYDSNDTAYYLNPATGATLAKLSVGSTTLTDGALGVGGAVHISSANYLYMGGTLGSLGSWGTREYASSGVKYLNSNGFYFDNVGYGSSWAFYSGTGGNITASVDFRAPIFYDNNNTAYYTDPASASRLGTVNADLLRSYGNVYTDGNYGHGHVGLYESTRLQGVFAMGDAYKLAADGASAGSLYGIAWSHPNAGSTGGANNLASHGMLILENGSFRGAWGGGRFVTTADIRGTLFYDYNDTNYYTDPASTSLLNASRHNSIVAGTTAGLSGEGQIGIYSGGSPYISFHSGTTSRTAYVQEASGRFYFGEVDYTESEGSFRSPLFYDVNNTGYYVDPASTSYVNTFNTAGTSTLGSHIELGNNLGYPNVQWNAASTSSGMVIFYLPGTTSNYGMVHMVFDIYEYNSPRVATVIIGGHNWSTAWYNIGCNVIGFTDKQVRVGVKDGRFVVVFGTSGSSWSYGTIVLRKIHNAGFYNDVIDMVGNWSATQTTTESFSYVSGDLRSLRTPGSFEVDGIGYSYSSFRAPIFYDNGNTAYYVDPASTTQLHYVLADNWFRPQGNTGLYFETYGRGLWSSDAGGNSYGNVTTYGSGRNSYIGWGLGSTHCFMSSGSSNVGVHDNSRGWVWYFDGSYTNFSLGYTQFAGSARAPIFYDSDDTNSYYTSNQFIMRGGDPTIYFRDTDHNSAMLHCNSNLLYILRGGNDTTSWSQVSGQWPFNWNLTNNDATCGGSFAAVGNVTAYASDRRLKTNIKTIENALEKVQSLSGVTFDWIDKVKDLGFRPDTMINDAGVIAQEVQEVFPQAIKPAPFDQQWNVEENKYISRSGEDYKTVQYEKIVPLLIEAIKELKAEIELLKNRG